MGRLRVAVFNTQPPHLYYGGVERRIMEIAKRVRGDIDIVVFSGTKAGFKRATRVDGVLIVPCHSTDNLFPIDNWFFNRAAARVASLINADVYEAHTVSGYGVLKALRKRRVPKPFIQTIHGVLMDEYAKCSMTDPSTPRTWLSRLPLLYLAKIEKEAANKADLIVTVSRYSMRKIVQLYQACEDKIRIVPNGVDVDRFRPMEVPDEFRSKMKLKNGRCVLFVGSLSPRKGLSLLIEAAKEVVKEERDVKFIIVGEGPLKNSLIAYAHRLGVLKNMMFLGSVSDDVLVKLYNCSDVVVLPSLQEGQGITLLEAQATAKPVVACNVGGVAEIVVHGETGFLVNPNSYELAQAMLRLLSDEALRRRMGGSGRRFVCKSFSWNMCAEKMLQVYVEASALA